MPTFQSQVDLVRQYLDNRIAGHTLHAANIANAETPNYRAKIPEFKATLDRIASRDPNNPDWKLEMKIKNSPQSPRQDGNNVNMEKEMSALAENSMRYISAVKILTKQMALERYAATSGGR